MAKNEYNGITIPPRDLRPGQRTQVIVADPATLETRVLAEFDHILLEAPNWTLDGKWLILNGDFDLWRLGVEDGRLEQIELSGVPIINNDHVLDPDGEHIYVSAFDWRVHRVPLAGGRGQLVEGDPGIPGFKHFLHGVSPDGERLAVIGVHPLTPGDFWGRGDVFTMSAKGDGDYRQLTDGPGPADGSEYSPDGEWIYFNTESFDGHAQIARLRPDGGDAEQLTCDEFVNWFPHLSPDGTKACYIAFPPGAQGHPAEVWVDIKVVTDGDWTRAKTCAHVFGGQGAINVNSWAPDSSAFAFVAYPEP
ncbi:MAG: biopolymer transporter Tol [Propionibacteriaceae bacterium]|jgi:Tol biopolymer transport system component|nr:biopolymer transporter Tol [Propionibacteriaceae bacterium]